MSKYVIDNDTLVSIADAIRSKDGTTDAILVSQMPDRIQAIPQEGGGGGVELPDEAFVLSGNCAYRFANNGWNWYLDLFGDKITTKDISNLQFFATESGTLTNIPFDLNIATNCYFTGMFKGCYELTTVPRIYGDLVAPTSLYGGKDLSDFFRDCRDLKEIPYDYFHSFGGDAFWEAEKNCTGGRANIFNYCYALRELPDISMLTNVYGYYGCLYYSMCNQCYSLNEIVDLPVITQTSFTSNAFYNSFSSCSRLKRLTFKMNEDGSPIVANWKNQTIDLSNCVGYFQYDHMAKNYGGFTTATQITDDATYQALKDNPDSWTAGYGYSRYDHDSAVETINTLPDVSATGGTNTIKFKGACGELTDAGAISTLTEEEIAVAATKGWTVTLS